MHRTVTKISKFNLSDGILKLFLFCLEENEIENFSCKGHTVITQSNWLTTGIF